jgi:hypothetical protein
MISSSILILLTLTATLLVANVPVVDGLANFDIFGRCLANRTFVGSSVNDTKKVSMCYKMETSEIHNVPDDYFCMDDNGVLCNPDALHNISFDLTYTYTYWKDYSYQSWAKLENYVVEIRQQTIYEAPTVITDLSTINITKLTLNVITSNYTVTACKAFKYCNTRTNNTFMYDCTNIKYGRKSSKCETIKPFFFPFTYDLLLRRPRN